MARSDDDIQPIASNRRARRDYEVLDTFEAGIALLGPEVKSLRAGRANMSDAYAVVRRGEVFLRNLHIAPYEQAGSANAEPTRERKLLLHKHEIRKLNTKVSERGLTIVPLGLHFRGGRAKVEIALAKGRRNYDKRQQLRRREQEREVSRIGRRGRR